MDDADKQALLDAQAAYDAAREAVITKLTERNRIMRELYERNLAGTGGAGPSEIAALLPGKRPGTRMNRVTAQRIVGALKDR